MQANNHLFVAATEPVKVSLLWLLRLLRLRLLKVLPRSCHSTLRFLAEKRCKDRNAESCCNQKNRLKSNQKLISYHVYIYICTVYMYYLSKFYLLIHLFMHFHPFQAATVQCSMAPRLRLFRPPRRRDLPRRTGSSAARLLQKVLRTSKGLSENNRDNDY